MSFMDLRELSRAQMVLAILVNAHDVHDWALHVADQVVPVLPETDGSSVGFTSHLSLPVPWEGAVALTMDGDAVWVFPPSFYHVECDVSFALGTRLDAVA